MILKKKFFNILLEAKFQVAEIKKKIVNCNQFMESVSFFYQGMKDEKENEQNEIIFSLLLDFRQRNRETNWISKN